MRNPGPRSRYSGSFVGPSFLCLKGDLKGIKLSFGRASELDSNDGVAHRLISVVLLDMGDLEGANLSLRRAIEIGSEDCAAHWLFV